VSRHRGTDCGSGCTQVSELQNGVDYFVIANPTPNPNQWGGACHGTVGSLCIISMASITGNLEVDVHY
jgi:hypothetical protein